MLICPNCNAQLEDDALFCDTCGTRIEHPEPGPAEPIPAPVPAPEPTAAESIYCPDCGQQIPADSPFCSNCGKSLAETVFCPNCGEKVSSAYAVCPKCSFRLFDAVYCPNCGNPSNPAAAFCKNCGHSLKAEMQPADSSGIDRKQKSKARKGILFAGLGVAVIAVLFVVFIFLGGKTGFGKKTGSSPDCALYIKDNEIFFSDLSKKEPLQVTSRFADADYLDKSDFAYSAYRLGGMCCFSKDGSLLFFPDKMGDNGYTLYWRKVNKPKEEATKIDSGIDYYSVSEDASYITYVKNETLYQYNRKKEDKQKIASDVRSFYVSDDARTILYLDQDNDLYSAVKGKDNGRERIDRDVSDLCYVADDLSIIFYIKDGDTLFKKENGKEKERVSSDVADVLRAYDSGKVYYIKSDEEELSLKDYINDDMEREDAAMTEPLYPDIDWSDPQREAKIDAYNKALEEYYAKLNRDYLREELKAMALPQNRYTLCFFDGKNETAITDAFNYDSYSVAADAPVITYTAYDQSDDVNIKLSGIENIYDVEEQVMKALYSAADRYIAAGSVSEIFDEEDISGFRISADGRLLCYLSDVPEGKNYGDLYKISISSSGKLGKPELCDNDVFTGYVRITGDGRILYFKDYRNDKGEFYADGKRIDDDVYCNSINYNKDTGLLVYYTDWSGNKSSGTLKTYSKKEPEMIADDVHDYIALPNGTILYLHDYSLKRYQGELYLWNKKKSQKIDEDVVCILPVY